MLVVDVFEVWEGEFLLEKSGEFFLDGLCPMTYEDDEFVDVPGYSTAKIILCPNLSMQMRIVDEGHASFGCFLYLLGGQFLFANAEEVMLVGIVPKDAHAWHLFVEGTHVVHLRLSVFIV